VEDGEGRSQTRVQQIGRPSLRRMTLCCRKERRPPTAQPAWPGADPRPPPLAGFVDPALASPPRLRGALRFDDAETHLSRARTDCHRTGGRLLPHLSWSETALAVR